MQYVIMCCHLKINSAGHLILLLERICTHYKTIQHLKGYWGLSVCLSASLWKNSYIGCIKKSSLVRL